MIPVKKFPEFNSKNSKKQIDFPEFKHSKQDSNGLFKRVALKAKLFYLKKFNNSPTKSGNVLDSLTHIKESRSIFDHINLMLMILLIIILLFGWQVGPALLDEIDQKQVDIKNQAEVIQMEEKNNEYLINLQKGGNELMQKIETVYSAIPNSDEKVEEVISMLEDLANRSSIIINAIGIREVPESQFYYDDLIGYVQPYEYTFSAEASLPRIMRLIKSLRTSFRIMDVITFEIDKGKDNYKANISLFVYHMIDENADDNESN